MSKSTYGGRCQRRAADSGRRRTRFRVVALLGIAITAGAAARAETTTTDAIVTESPATAVVPPGRPRIGLVLGGGGAKGAAHVGVIRVLDQLRVPIDCIVGTSMGALVGGIYATGVDAQELDERVRAISWSDAIAFTTRRDKLPMRRKLAGVTYSNALEFGVRDQGLTVPSGFINTQNIEQTIRLLTMRGLGVRDFDRLPIRFRAIATDMQKGEMVVLSSGDLATAMRASMAVPGIFAPVNMDGRVLGDGGLTRNVPVDIARQTCADVVIAVALPNPVPTPEEMQSPLTMMSRTLDVLVGANEREQLRALGERDVAIVIDPGAITSGSFTKVADAIPLGEAAALAHRDELARYSVGEAEYVAWREHTARGARSSVQLAEVNVGGLERVDESYVRAKLGLEKGSIVDQRLLSERVDDVYALDEFDRVEYSLTGDPDRPVLDIVAREKPWGPNLVRFDVGLQVTSDSETAFVLGGDYVRSGLNAFGGELHGVLAIGRTSTAQLSLYQPIERQRRYFVEPTLSAHRSIEDLYFDDDAVARYKFTEAIAELEVGQVFGNRAELRAGIVTGRREAERDIAAPEFLERVDEPYGGWTLKGTYDTRDRVALPTRGWLVRANYFDSDDGLGSDSAIDYSRLEGLVAHTLPLWDDVVELTLTGGTSFGDPMPLNDQFSLGGPISFPGLNIGALRGEEYWAGTARYMHKVADISPLFGQALYIGLQLSAAEMRYRIDGLSPEEIYSGAVVLAGRTPLGPLYLSLATTSTDQWQLLFGVGRPIEERTIADSEW